MLLDLKLNPAIRKIRYQGLFLCDIDLTSSTDSMYRHHSMERSLIHITLLYFSAKLNKIFANNSGGLNACVCYGHSGLHHEKGYQHLW